MNKLVEVLRNLGYTENGALCYKSTGNPLLDLFFFPSRNWKEEDIFKITLNSLKFDKVNTARCIAYFRNRDGVGERKISRWMMSILLAFLHHDNAVKLCELIPEFGRWDDLVYLYTKTGRTEPMEVISNQLASDLTSETPSLLAKWLPSEVTSSKETVKSAREVRKFLKLSSKDYRKTLSMLRKQLRVLEVQMSRGDWTIDYESVPAQAMLKYRKAFLRHDSEGYSKYLDKVRSGKAKMNTKSLAPYQIVHRVRSEGRESLELQTMWDNLPNMISEEVRNALVVCDVSASMGWTTFDHGLSALEVAVSLALYFSEKCNGEFKDTFITFSESPSLQVVTGDSLRQRIYSIVGSNFGLSTDINKVFTLVLERAKRANIPADQMPKAIYILSDMEFNEACPNETNFEVIQDQYQQSGYGLPRLIFWNIGGRGSSPVSESETGVTLLSGFSSYLFQVSLGDNPLTTALKELEKYSYIDSIWE